jgi:hypothetical protein
MAPWWYRCGLIFGPLFYIFSLSVQAQTDEDEVLRLADSIRARRPVVVTPDTTVGGRMEVFSGDTLYKSPWGAVVRSLVVPGWGQWYNERPLKAGVYLASDVTMLAVYFQRDRKVSRIEKRRKSVDRQLRTDPFLTQEQKQILSARFGDLTDDLDTALNRRNLFGWFFAISHLLSLMDAYTDAHLFRFDDKINLSLRSDGATALLQVRLAFR